MNRMSWRAAGGPTAAPGGRRRLGSPGALRACLTIAVQATLALAVVWSASALTLSAGARAETLTPQAAAAKERAMKLMESHGVWNGPESSPKPIPGKRIAVVPVTMAGEGAARPSRAIVEAGKLVGWSVDILDGRGDPTEANKALNAAVDAKYDGIVLLYVDTHLVSEAVGRILGAKIPFVTMGGLNNEPKDLPDVSHDWVAHGTAIADYMIWKSNGALNALLLKETQTYVVEHGQFVGTYDRLSDKSMCSGCRTTVVPWTISNIDTQPAEITTAALQADPSLNWVWCFDTCLTRIVRSLTASGIQADNLKIAGFDCDGENLSFIKDGQYQVVSACDPRDWESYAVVDTMNRLFHGEPQVSQHIPIKMYASENIADLKPEELKIGWQGDYDFRAKYKKLWGVQ